MHQGNHLAQGRLLAGTGDLHTQQPIEIDCAAKYLHALNRFQGDRFASDRRGIQARLAGHHQTIGGHPIAGAYFHQVAGLEAGVVHFHDAAIGPYLSRQAAGQAAQGVDGFLGADHAALFQYVAEDHDDRQQGRGQQVASGPGAEHRQGDQLVGNAVQARVTQAEPGRAHHRHRHQQRGDTQQQLADAHLPWGQPAPDQAKGQKPQGEHGQGQLAGGAALLGRGQHAGGGRGMGGGSHCSAP